MADSKGRIACRDLFPPHASFEAFKEPDGRVTLIRLGREDRKPRLVKPVVRKGLLVVPMENAELDLEALPGVLACRRGRGFRGPYRQLEMGQAETHYL